MSEEKWEVKWTIFGYGISWYAEKLYKNIPIHIFLGLVVSLPIWGIITYLKLWAVFGVWGIVIKILLSVFNPLLLGGAIEWTQNDKTGKKWVDRKIWLLGSVRDVLTYATFTWIVWL